MTPLKGSFGPQNGGDPQVEKHCPRGMWPASQYNTISILTSQFSIPLGFSERSITAPKPSVGAQAAERELKAKAQPLSGHKELVLSSTGGKSCHILRYV